jgi:hypothetical protein
LSEAEFLELREKLADAFEEYTADGSVIVMLLTDPGNGAFRAEVLCLCSRDAAWFDQARGV